MTQNRNFLVPLQGKPSKVPPIWLMRQAGRYLPEYREVRGKAGDFLTLCYTPALAAEVTLQPIRRYGFDAAILFSDILVVPDALGQPVRFVEGEGPRLDPITSAAGLTVLDPGRTGEKFGLVSQTVQRLRQDLPEDVELIGFCGAPWTVATYMVGGRGSPDQAAARQLAYSEPATMQRLIDLLVEVSIDYLQQQIEAGAGVIQIFDSWAGSLPDEEFSKWVVAPTKRIVAALNERYPGVPVIGFPRGAGASYHDFVQQTGVNGVSCDTSMPLKFMRDIDGGMAVQGNLDPLLLVSGGEALDRRARQIVETMKGRPFIFNLGHGIVPQTPPENVARLVDVVRSADSG